MKSILAFFFAATVFGTNAASSQQYRAIEVKDGGIITGSVLLEGEAPKNLYFEISKDKDWCGTRKSSPRLVLAKNNGVRNAVVSLENILEGKNLPLSKRFVLDQRRCEYDPHVLLLPMGSDLEIMNSDGVLHNVHTYDTGERTVFNIAQPIKGFRFPVKHFKTPGVYSATCDAGHPWMSAYIIVAEHPYYALTDANGGFSFANVPPGTYRIKMWHEGVTVARTEIESGKPKAYHYEAPYEEIQEVTVPLKGNVVVDFKFRMRTGAITRK